MSHPNIRILDRAKETTTTTGSGAISLGGAVAGFVAISGVGNSNSTYYTIQEGNNFEVGIGTYASGDNTLSRDEIFSSSNSDDSKIDLAGSATVFITYPADKAVVETSGGYVGIGGIDPEYQLVVSGTGSFNTVRWADGTTQTTAATDTTYTAGTGLALVGTEFNVSGIDSTMIIDGTVSNTDLANSSITITAGTGLSNAGAVSLGGTVTLDADAGTTSASGIVRLQDSATDGTTDRAITPNAVYDISGVLSTSIASTGSTNAASIATNTTNIATNVTNIASTGATNSAAISTVSGLLYDSWTLQADSATTTSVDTTETVRFTGAGNTSVTLGGTDNRVVTISGSSAGGGGAPTDAQYVTLALDGDLSAERVLAASTGVHIVDGGANGNVTVSVSGSTTSQLGIVQLQDAATDGTTDKAITPNAVYDISGVLASDIASTGSSNLSLIRSYIDTSDNATFNNVTAQGNLTVSGTLTYLDSTTVTIADKQLELASNSGTPIGNDAAVNDGGIVVKSTDSDKKWTWLDATDAWTSTENIKLNSGKKIIFGDGTEQSTSPTGDISTVSGLLYDYWTLRGDTATTTNVDTTETVQFTGAGNTSVTLGGTDNRVVTISGSGGGDTTYTAGTGLSLADTEFNVSGIDSTMIVDGSVTNSDLQNSSITITAGTGLSNGGAVSLGASVTVDADTASTSQVGVVQLQDSATDGTTDRAITPNAVYDISGVLSASIASTGSTNAANIATNTSNISTNSSNISTNTSNIAATGATNAANIATNATAIATKAPNDAQYVALATDSDLSAERVLTAGSGMRIVDAGANGAVTLHGSGVTVTAGNGLSDGGLVSLGGSVTLNADNASTSAVGVVQLQDSATDGTTDKAITPNAVYDISGVLSTSIASTGATNASSIGTNTSNISTNTTNIASTGATNATAIATKAPNDAQYIALATDGDLSAERVLTAGSGIRIVDGGANGPVTLHGSGITLGGVSVNLGGSDATPAFNLSDATDYKTTNLDGTITNAQLAGSIANDKLANSSVTVTAGTGLSNGGEVALGASVSIDADTATTSAVGVVQLQDSATNGTTDKAITPNAVYDISGVLSTSIASTGATNASSIGTNTSNISTNTSNISTNTSNIASTGATNATAISTKAPNDAQYVALATDGDLSAERVLTAGSGIRIVDAGANGAVTLHGSGITVTAGSGLEGGGSVALGGTVTLDTAETGWFEKIGINDRTPDAMLDVVCASDTDVGLRIEMTAAGSAKPFEIVRQGGSHRASIDTAGDLNCGAISGSGSTFTYGRANISPTFRIASGANNLNIRNPNTDKDINFDVHTTAGAITFRDYPNYKRYFSFKMGSDSDGTGMYIISRDDTSILTQWQSSGGTPVAMVNPTGAISGQHFIFGDGTVQTTASAGGGGGGAPTDAQYVTLATDGDLSAERVLTAGSGIRIVDAGANGAVTLHGSGVTVTAGNGLSNGGLVSLGGSVTINADSASTSAVGVVQLQDSATDGTTDKAITPNAVYDISGVLSTRIASTGATNSSSIATNTSNISTNTSNIASTGATNATAIATKAPNDAQYVALATDGDLSAERVLTAGSGIRIVDAGANGAVTLHGSGITLGGVTVNLGGSDATPAFNLSDATDYPTSSLDGTITNAQLAGSIANDKLANSSVNFGGISLSLGGSDTTPAFDLSDATAYKTTALDGTITNTQLAGSIANAKLSNSAITITAGTGLSNGGSVALGASVSVDADTATTSAVGVVQLQDSATDGTVNRAITPNAVYDISGVLQAKIDAGGGGGGSPGGSNTQLQYNNSSSFGGMSQFTYSSNALHVTDDTPVYFGDSDDRGLLFDSTLGTLLATGSATSVLQVSRHGNTRLTITAGDAASTTSRQSQLYMIAGTAGNSKILLGDTDDNDVCMFNYVHGSTNDLKLSVNGTAYFRFESEGTMFFKESSSNPSADGNGGYIWNRDQGMGVKTMNAMDSMGNITMISPHAPDAPEWLYDWDVDRMSPKIVRELNHYAGIVRYTNYTRQARLLERLLNRWPAPIDALSRKVIHEETFEEYNVRTGHTLERVDWDTDQLRMKSERDAEIATWEAMDDEDKVGEPRPEEHTILPKPEWLIHAEANA